MERRVGEIDGDQGASPVEDVVREVLTARATVDEHGTVTAWNDGARRLLGYTAAQILGRPVATLLAEEPAAADLPPFAQLPRWHGTLALRHRDGHIVDAGVLAHHHPAPHGDGDRAGNGDRGGNGEGGGLPGGGGGGSWLVLSPLAGQESRPVDEDLVSWSFTQSPCCALALYDTTLRLRRANAEMERSVGLAEGEMRGLRIPEIVDNDTGEISEQDMLRVLETGETYYRERYLRAPGEKREHAWSIFVSPLRDAAGRTHGVFLSAHDITEQHWARKRLQLIAEAGRTIGSTLDVARTAQELADVAVPELADFISIDLLTSLDDESTDHAVDADEQDPQARSAGRPLALRRVAHQSVLPGVPEAVVAPGEVDAYPGGSPQVRSLRSGRAVLHRMTEPVLAEWAVRDPLRSARLREAGVHSMMTVPLTARGTTLGVAVLIRHRHPEEFQEDDLLLAEELASRAAVCIDNALRYTRERGTAVTLQRSLLPQRLPEQAAVEVASRYLPAGARAGVGGDWFDVIPLSGARVALVVGDVVGHGIHASAAMGRLRTAVRTLADIDLPPDELLTHLDDLVGRLAAEAADPDAALTGNGEVAGDVGATCLYAVYDPVSRRCVLARAGHPLPMVVSPDGTVELLDLPAGPPLGLGGLPFESVETELPEGTLLALYTNGLTESRNPAVDDGVSRLRQALTRPAASLEHLCDAVLAATLPGRRVDDVALLLARTRALDADRVATWTIPPDPAAVAETRRNALGQLDSWNLSDVAFVTELIVSELVTNAIRHAEPPIQLRLIYDRTLICEVSDASSTVPHLRRARVYDEGGRGLLLVAHLTQRWGTRPTAKGKTIWAEQTIDAPGDAGKSD
ncbi:PAS domain S-box-containing protein [Streptomyces sp. LBL]|uniref:SpoIIE family protein phosphatase n=1 Tax=Streptomyces sp. LBL TaxID=2940562 RepID=UPI002475AFE7|nr:SpoIIE family protein phosphatase [Streptomyces sp. LBL]MDH6628259.1 PAS domain S-box-containing protein [Streptomyces sp. LBL]